MEGLALRFKQYQLLRERVMHETRLLRQRLDEAAPGDIGRPAQPKRSTGARCWTPTCTPRLACHLASLIRPWQQLADPALTGRATTLREYWHPAAGHDRSLQGQCFPVQHVPCPMALPAAVPMLGHLMRNLPPACAH